MSSEYHTASESGAGDLHGYSESSSSEPGAESSANPSRPTSEEQQSKQRGRVRFNSTSESNDLANKRSSFPLQDKSHSTPEITQPPHTKSSPAHSRNSSVTTLLRHTPEQEVQNPFLDPINSHVFRPKASVLRNNSAASFRDLQDDEKNEEKTFSALSAQERAQRLANSVGSHSAPNTRRNSVDDDTEEEVPRLRPGGYPVRIDDIPLVDMDSKRSYDGPATDSEEEEPSVKDTKRGKSSGSSEAHKLVRAHTRRHARSSRAPAETPPGLASGQVTPLEDRLEGYVPAPQKYRGGILSSLLKLYNAPHQSGTRSRRGSEGSTTSPSATVTPGSQPSSGSTTPRTKNNKWYNHKNQSQETLAGLEEASAILGAAGGVRTPKGNRPGMGRRAQSAILNKSGVRPRLEDEIKITVHIAETLSRQKYLVKLCRALMMFGAPTHRLEEYMKMSARVLEIDGQFLYIPGSMIVSFDDASTHTTEVKLVRVTEGVDLGKLKDIHEIYKEVVHDVIGVEEATQRMDTVLRAKPMYNRWLLVLVFGCASATVAPFGKSCFS